jgi:hypothetical protein
MTMREDIERIIELTKAIAAELGDGWAYVEPTDSEPYPTQRIERGAAQLYCRIEWNHKERIAVSGSMSFGKNSQYLTVYDDAHQKMSVPDITVAIARGVPAIAKAIRSRLLPTYLDMVERAVAMRERDRLYVAKRRENLSALAAIVGAQKPKDDETEHTSWHSDGAKGYGDIWASDSSVNLKLSSLSVETATKVLELLAQGVL